MATQPREREFTSDWVTWHESDWRKWLAPWAGKPKVHALAIGCHEGRSDCWFCDNILTGPGCLLTCVDGWWHESAFKRWCRNTAGLPVAMWRGPSEKAIPHLIDSGRRFSFAYVDGGHRPYQVLTDLCMVWQVIEVGGVVIADDYGWTSPQEPIGPKPGIDAFLECFKRRIAKYEISPSKEVGIWKAS